MLVGIDLAYKRKSALAILINNAIITFKVENKRLLKAIKKVRPSKVVIDCPLVNPKSIKEPFRDFEKELMKKGFKLLPLTLPSMKKLTKEGYKLKKELEKEKIRVFETHPRSIEKILKKRGITLEEYLEKEGIEIINEKVSKDERDAILCLIPLILLEKNRKIFKKRNFILPWFSN